MQISKYNIITVTSDWDDELSCFESILRELALLYSKLPLAATFSPSADDENIRSTDAIALNVLIDRRAEKIISTVFYPAFRAYLIPQSVAGLSIQIAALEQLYKVFERC